MVPSLIRSSPAERSHNTVKDDDIIMRIQPRLVTDASSQGSDWLECEFGGNS